MHIDKERLEQSENVIMSEHAVQPTGLKSFVHTPSNQLRHNKHQKQQRA